MITNKKGYLYKQIELILARPNTWNSKYKNMKKNKKTKH